MMDWIHKVLENLNEIELCVIRLTGFFFMLILCASVLSSHLKHMSERRGQKEG